MEYRVKHGICYVSLGGAFPAGAKPALRPASPLVILVRRDPVHSRGFWAITDLGQLTEPEGPAALLPRLVSYSFIGNNVYDPLSTAFYLPIILLLIVTGFSFFFLRAILLVTHKYTQKSRKEKQSDEQH